MKTRTTIPIRLIMFLAIVMALASCQTNDCCKVCDEGKACGDSCISESYTCHQDPGCACDKSDL